MLVLHDFFFAGYGLHSSKLI